MINSNCLVLHECLTRVVTLAQVRQLPAAAAADDDIDRPLAAPWAADSCLTVLFEVLLTAVRPGLDELSLPKRIAWAPTKAWIHLYLLILVVQFHSLQGQVQCRVNIKRRVVAKVLMLLCPLAQREEWRDAWLAGEAGEAQAVAEEALEAPGAWDPAPAAWLMDADDDAAVFGGGSGPDGADATRPAWQVGAHAVFAANTHMLC